MKVRYDSHCGLNCGACPVGRANEMDDAEAIKKYAEDWGTTVEALSCTGCKTDVTAKYCTDCEMRLCARSRGLEFCVECDEYPCKDITDFRNDRAPHHSAVFKNLKNIEEKGLEEWLKNQKIRWSCSTCRTSFDWYSETCKKCGTKLFNAVDEEKDLQN